MSLQFGCIRSVSDIPVKSEPNYTSTINFIKVRSVSHSKCLNRIEKGVSWKFCANKRSKIITLQ